MFSSIFVDRPRLAVVIALVTAIAGLVSLLAIPIAQFPNIVPPQVSVTASYPGASSEVVDTTVAQVIESQVIGVDQMIYMKSISGNDGSYSLLVSFELGTNPDINTVNVNNRVQVALSKMPDEVRRSGVRVQKKSSALLGVIAVYSPKETHDELFLSNYVTINLLDRIKSTPGVGDAILFGPQDYSMRVWIKTDQLTGLGITTGDIIAAIQSQNVQAAVGRIGARPISDDQQLQLNIQTKGRLTLARGIRKHHHSHQPGRFDPAAGIHRANTTWSGKSRSCDTTEWLTFEPHRHLSVARRQCIDHDRSTQKTDE